MGEKRKAQAPPVADEEDVMRIIPLGAGNEVGRSCMIVKYKGKTVMLDCGIHPAYTGLASLPFFDFIDPSEIDLLLVTHFHLDHAGALPYFMQKTSFRGKVFMTHPTKSIFRWLLADYLRVSTPSAASGGQSQGQGGGGGGGAGDQLFTEEDLINCTDRITPCDFHSTYTHNGIRFTPYNAGHVLGAAMFVLEISGIRLLYTGDYSREEDRHLMAAERPSERCEVLVAESTYGVQSHEPVVEREARFTRLVHDIVLRGGRCLVPVFALGRAQELLLILDEYWQRNPGLQGVPIYYASSLARKCMAVYETYTHFMHPRIRRMVSQTGHNPFRFRHVSSLRSADAFDDTGPCVMLASPGMLQNGISRELLERWAGDARNGTVFAGYLVEGTLGKKLLSEPDEFEAMSGRMIKRRMSIHYVTFSAHVDYAQNSAFIEEMAAPHLVLVHGDFNEMSRLRAALQSRMQERDQGERMKVYTPANGTEVRLHFRGEKVAKTIGRLAIAPPTPSARLSGLLVTRDLRSTLLHPLDLPDHVPALPPVSIVQRLTLPTAVGRGLVSWHLAGMFGGESVVESEGKGAGEWRVMECVTVVRVGVPGEDDEEEKEKDSGVPRLVVEWVGDPVTDTVADAVVGCLAGMEGSRASVRVSGGGHSHSHSHGHGRGHEHTEGEKDEDRKLGDVVSRLLANHFGPEAVENITLEGDPEPLDDVAKGGWVVHTTPVPSEDTDVTIGSVPGLDVASRSEDWKRRAGVIVARAKRVVGPVVEVWRPAGAGERRDKAKNAVGADSDEEEEDGGEEGKQVMDGPDFDEARWRGEKEKEKEAEAVGEGGVAVEGAGNPAVVDAMTD